MRYQFARSQLHPELAPSTHPDAALELSATLRAGSVVAKRYRIDRHIATNQDVLVYAGLDLRGRTPVALRLLPRGADPKRVGAFVRESELSCRVKHLNVVETHDLVAGEDGSLIGVTELLGGETLDHTLARCGSLRWERAQAILLQLCAGLEAVHEAGIVLRDLGPKHCFRVTGRGPAQVKLVDFGAARPPGFSPLAPLERSAASELGFDPAYASPELAAGEFVDHRQDIYALGVLMCVLLTGRAPFIGATAQRVLMRNLYDPPPTLAKLAPELELGPKLESVYARALDKDPELRFASAAEFAAALEA